jgi:hypothetical protein
MRATSNWRHTVPLSRPTETAPTRRALDALSCLRILIGKTIECKV